MEFATNLCSPLVHQGQKESWNLALMFQTSYRLNLSFQEKVDESHFIERKTFGCENEASSIGLQSLIKKKKNYSLPLNAVDSRLSPI